MTCGLLYHIVHFCSFIIFFMSFDSNLLCILLTNQVQLKTVPRIIAYRYGFLGEEKKRCLQLTVGTLFNVGVFAQP